jgi:hypothetical protein
MAMMRFLRHFIGIFLRSRATLSLAAGLIAFLANGAVSVIFIR